MASDRQPNTATDDQALGALNGKSVAVIGASKGIGLALARSLTERGCRVMSIARTSAHLMESARDIGAHAFACDISKDDAGAMIVAEAERLFGGLDILVFSAGHVELASLSESNLDALDLMYRTYLRGAWAVTQAVAPLLIKSGGQIGYMASNITRATSTAGRGQYASIQAGLSAMIGAVRQELNPLGVRIVAVHSGSTDTPGQQSIHAQINKQYNPDLLLRADDVALAMCNAFALPLSAETTDIYIRPMSKH